MRGPGRGLERARKQGLERSTKIAYGGWALLSVLLLTGTVTTLGQAEITERAAVLDRADAGRGGSGTKHAAGVRSGRHPAKPGANPRADDRGRQHRRPARHRAAITPAGAAGTFRHPPRDGGTERGRCVLRRADRHGIHGALLRQSAWRRSRPDHRRAAERQAGKNPASRSRRRNSIPSPIAGSSRCAGPCSTARGR